MKVTKNVLTFKMTSAKAKQLIANIADCSSNVIFTTHALKRMKQRNITPPQVIKCLKKGTVTEHPAVKRYAFRSERKSLH